MQHNCCIPVEVPVEDRRVKTNSLWPCALPVQVNLKQYVARMTDQYTFAAPVSSANVCFQSAHLGNASYLDIRTDQDGDRLDYKPVDLPGQPHTVSCVAVTLPTEYVLHTLWRPSSTYSLR